MGESETRFLIVLFLIILPIVFILFGAASYRGANTEWFVSAPKWRRMPQYRPYFGRFWGLLSPIIAGAVMLPAGIFALVATTFGEYIDSDVLDTVSVGFLSAFFIMLVPAALVSHWVPMAWRPRWMIEADHPELREDARDDAEGSGGRAPAEPTELDLALRESPNRDAPTTSFGGALSERRDRE